ncbi:hypothetical protein CC78DRAFT_548055 [Lojkania enalia]|uniref:Uncharacterized protein n=1 Tax=Lojkania enalia TaxID=147567 RepID=A0A9P4K0H8_9PLEO|nr:hypothetical protein CC78DRAFT_548055 [Didymosphaeria enalia]
MASQEQRQSNATNGDRSENILGIRRDQDLFTEFLRREGGHNLSLADISQQWRIAPSGSSHAEVQLLHRQSQPGPVAGSSLFAYAGSTSNLPTRPTSSGYTNGHILSDQTGVGEHIGAWCGETANENTGPTDGRGPREMGGENRHRRTDRNDVGRN